MLRCVHFPPGGNSVIVGGMNSNQEDPIRRAGRGRNGAANGGISFYLRLWDFDIDAALHPPPTVDELGRPRGTLRLHRKTLGNVSTGVYIR